MRAVRVAVEAKDRSEHDGGPCESIAGDNRGPASDDVEHGVRGPADEEAGLALDAYLDSPAMP